MPPGTYSVVSIHGDEQEMGEMADADHGDAVFDVDGPDWEESVVRCLTLTLTLYLTLNLTLNLTLISSRGATPPPSGCTGC